MTRIVLIALAISLTSCGLTRQDARDVLSVTKAACIVANALLPDDRVAALCGFVQTTDPALQELLGKAREQNAAGRVAGAASVGCR